MRKYQNQLLLFFCITFLISVLSVMKFPGGFRLFVVQLSSMEPTIKAKSLIIVRSQKFYQERDIITFFNENLLNEKYPTITHRLQRIINENGQVFFMTKGDGNNFSDQNFVPYNQVVGKVIKVFPYLGWIVDIVKSTAGIVFFVFLPAFLIIRNEYINILDELKK